MKLIQTSLIVAGGVVIVGAAAYMGVKAYKNHVQKKMEETVLEKAKEEFAACAHSFSGLYEPLFMMEKGSLKYRTGVIGDWTTRTANLTVAPNYRDIWISRLSDYSNWEPEQGLIKIKELLSFILDAGVCRDSAAQIIVDSVTYKKYSTSDDEMIEEGNPAIVKIPCWFIGDEVIEKGIIEEI